MKFTFAPSPWSSRLKSARVHLIPLLALTCGVGPLFAQEARDTDSTSTLETTYVESSPAPTSRPVRQPRPIAVPRPVIVDTIVESATRSEKRLAEVPSAVGLITRDEIDRTSPLSFDDLIRFQPNVEMYGGPRYLGEQLVIRAQGGNAVTVRIDDARQNFVSGHAGQRFFVEPEFMKNIEILRGGGSFLYGSGAAGVVNISTLDPQDIARDGNPLGLRVRNAYHSNSGEWIHSVTGAASSENLDLMIGTSDRDGGNITLSDGVELQDSAIDRQSNIAKMVVRPGDDQQLTFTVFDYKSLDQGAANPQGDTDSTTNPPVGREVTFQQWTGNYEWDPIGNDLIDLELTFYYNTTSQIRNYIDTTGSNVGRQNIHDLEVFGIDFQNRSLVAIGNLEHEIVFGIDYFTESQDGTESRALFQTPGTPGKSGARPVSEADHFAVFATDEIALTDSLTLFTGIRYDTYETTKLAGVFAGQEDSSLSPHVGFNLELNERFSLFGKYSKAFTQPTLNDLYQDGSHFGVVPSPSRPFFETIREPVGGFFLPAPFGPGAPEPGRINVNYFEEVFIPNPDLLPETSDILEFGVHYEDDDFAGGKVSARLTGFYQRGENTFDTDIVGTRTTGGYPGFANPADVPAETTPVRFGPFAPPVEATVFSGIDFDGQIEQAFRQTINRAETEIYGAEFNFDYDAEEWFTSFVAGTVRSEDLDTGLPLNTNTGDQLSLTLGIRPLENLELGAYGIWNSGRKDLVADPFTQTSAYDIYGVFATYRATETWELRFGVDNLFDQAYERTSIAQEEPGRNVFFSSTIHW